VATDVGEHGDVDVAVLFDEALRRARVQACTLFGREGRNSSTRLRFELDAIRTPWTRNVLGGLRTDSDWFGYDSTWRVSRGPYNVEFE
jgi:hypothetical protein